jgi:hypothetical protein
VQSKHNTAKHVQAKWGEVLNTIVIVIPPSISILPPQRRAMTTTVPFINSLSSGVNLSTEWAHHTHTTEGEYTHAHVPGEHGHIHEHLDHPGG